MLARVMDAAPRGIVGQVRGWVVAALTFFYIVFSSSAVSIPSVLIRPRRMSLA